jgi:murein DD-endopeptidase
MRGAWALGLACLLAPGAHAGQAATTAADAGAGTAATASPPDAGSGCDWKHADVTVRGSIAASLVAAIGAQNQPGKNEGSVVAAHVARLFMWDLDLRREVASGDTLRLLWREIPDAQPEIGAARYHSQHLGRPLRAYRFRAAADAHPSYWDERGVEVPRRLEQSPLASYEQITALLKDRPSHKGMDFKCAIGTPVEAPRAAVVTRVNWKRGGNGNCVELRYDDGTLAKFLHLDSIKVRPGARVRAGQVIAASGNTGHSTAPHLHYQLDRDARIVDPVEYHGVTRRRLGGADLAAFKAQVAALARTCGERAP